MSYWVYENYPNDKAMVHKALCPWCNHGKGTSGTGYTKNGEWQGPFSNVQEAHDKAQSTERSDIRDCAQCFR